MPRSSTFRNYDRLLDGRLTELLDDWRQEGLSYETIADKLRNGYGLEVTTSTVCRWVLSNDEDGAA